MSTRITSDESERARLGILRSVLADWRFRWLAMLLPIAFLLPAFPIDETRYLAVAWEIYVRQDYIVLHLNGATYPDKGPFVFWLINALWLIVKPSVWSVRVAMLITMFLCVEMTSGLASRLGGSAQMARYSALLFAGMLYTSFFSEAVMFDVVLTAFVLRALHGILDLEARDWRRGTSVVAIAGGFGILTKGPVALLPVSFVLLLAPCWSMTARAQRAKWYVSSATALIGAVAIALVWAIPAARRGGPDYAHAIFLGQTAGRVAHSFAHARAVWWYLVVLPVIALPWSISVRASIRELIGQPQTKSARFAIVWFAPALAVFCLISGKQAHYLLPLMPALAIYVAGLIDPETVRIDARAFAWLLVALAASAFVIRQFSLSDLEVIRAVQSANPLWLASIAALGMLLLVKTTWHTSTSTITLVSTAVAVLCMLAAAQVYAPRIDMTASADRIRTAQTNNRPIAFIGLHQGLFELSGRLIEPLEQLSAEELPDWCLAHPDGELVTSYSKYTFAAAAAFTQPFAFGTVRFWNASELCAQPNPIEDKS